MRTPQFCASYRLLIGALALVASSCGNTEPGSPREKAKSAEQSPNPPAASDGLRVVKAPPSRKAPTDPPKVQSVKASDQSPLGLNSSEKGERYISIREDWLGKEFLLQSNVLVQDESPEFRGLLSRIISFKEQDGALVMLDSDSETLVTAPIPHYPLVAKFSIIEKSGGWLTFDFNSGMSSIFSSADWHPTAKGASYRAADRYEAAGISSAFIEEARFTGSQKGLLIRQVGQSSESQLPVEMRYYLTPYQSNPQFSPLPIAPSERFGYFTGAAVPKTTGSAEIRAVKWDTRSGTRIRFALSANTPQDLRPTIREGVLYWNQFLGKDTIEVIDAPPGISAPDPDYNLIQWVESPQADYAYADAQLDPRTGQVLHAQIYLPSSFLHWGSLQARRLAKYPRFVPRGFRSGRLCDYPVSGELGDEAGLTSLARLGSSATVLRTTQDYLRETVAHEMGHILGLRHNFAGSLAANFELKDRPSLKEEYLLTGKVRGGVVISSSVMDYLKVLDRQMVGRMILDRPEAMVYDSQAIQHLYLGKNFARPEIPPFCTDQDADGTIADCRRSDTGNDFLEYVRWNFSYQLENLAGKLLDHFIEGKTPPSNSPVIEPKDRQMPDALELAETILDGRPTVYALFTEETQFLRSRLSVEIFGAEHARPTKSAELDSLLGNDGRTMRAVAAALQPIPHDFVEVQAKNFETLLEDRALTAGIGFFGKTYSFSDDEIATMKRSVRIYLEHLWRTLVKSDVETMSAHHAQKSKPTRKKYLDHPASLALAGIIKDRVEHIVFAESGKQRAQVETFSCDYTPLEPGAGQPSVSPKPNFCSPQAGSQLTEKVTRTEMDFPVYRYDRLTRVVAARALMQSHGLNSAWGEAERRELTDRWKARSPLGDKAAALHLKGGIESSFYNDYLEITEILRPRGEKASVLDDSPGDQKEGDSEEELTLDRRKGGRLGSRRR